MLIAEDLLLLLTDDETGTCRVGSSRLGFALAGAVLVELVLAGRVDLTEAGRWGGARVVVVNPEPTGDPLLDDALAHLHGKGDTGAQAFVTHRSRGLADALRERLVARGILRAEQGRVLGIFPRRTWPAADVTHEGEVRAALHDVVVVGRAPSDREVSLVALLHAVREVPHQLAGAGLTAEQLRDRATALSADSTAADTVRRAIAATEAAVMASISASAAVAGS